MKNVLYTFITLTALALMLVVATAAQNPAAQSAENFVTEKGFKSRIFDVRHRDPSSLARVLRSLGSGVKGAEVTPSTEFRTLTVRDYPENLTVMEEALKRLDTPAVARPNIELYMYVLLGSKTGDTSPAQMPADIRDVLTQLRETFNFRGFELATTLTQRLTDSERGLSSGGTMQVANQKMPTGTLNVNYNYMINQISLSSNAAGAPVLHVSDFRFEAQAGALGARLQTALNLRDGEKVVVGTAAFEDRALIVVLTAKLLK